jgi:hypothetical protein
MKTKVFYLLALIGLTYVCWWSTKFLFGVQSPSAIISATWILALILILVAKRVNAWVWIYAGLVILIALCLPDWLVIDLFQTSPAQPVDPQFTLLMIFCAALVVIALLLQSSLNLPKPQGMSIDQTGDFPTPRKHSRWVPVVALGLGALLLVKGLHFYYWFMIWDSTNDPLMDLWLFIFPAPTVLFSNFVLLVTLPGKTKLISPLYLLLIPALWAVSASAQSVDFRQLTEERAGQVNQAIETFYAREGRYPHALGQLIPWYAISLPSPLIIYGQDWCYDADDDYYRLGYVDREHWSSPNWIGRIYKAKGAAPDLQPICDKAIAAGKER